MSRIANLLLVIACWAAIYLPGLGSLEIKGEEGRRILPAVTMIETGNWLVPHVGSELYFRKPPLVNWLVGISFSISGYRNEWMARLPSALAVLAVAALFVTLARTSLGPTGSLIGALVWMVNFGIIEKGRLIEIEAIYVSLVGIAIVCWLHWYSKERSPWLRWTIPAIFLGLAFLAKGPIHLLFFYSIVVAVLFFNRELRELLHPAHIVGILIVIGIFAIWAVPYYRAVGGSDLVQTWSVQLTGRLAGDDFKFTSWLLNLPRSLAYFLPWTLLLPLVRNPIKGSARETNLHRALIYGCGIPFLLVNLLPGALPRYSMPVLVPASWLMAMSLTGPDLKVPEWRPLQRILALNRRLRLVISVAIFAGIALSLYALFVVPLLQRRSKVRSIATQIDALVPDSEPLYAVDPDYQPFLFYIRSPIRYVSRVGDLPVTARYILVQPENERSVLESDRWGAPRPSPILRITDYRKRSVILIRTSD